jgi:hypothetical protein
LVPGSITNELQDDPEQPSAPAIVLTLGRTEEPFMAYQANPNDPYRTTRSDEEKRRAAEFDNLLQPDPELAEGPVSGTKVALYALGAALVLGAIFYSLNNSTVNRAGTTPQEQTAQTPPAAPPGMRDVTPRTNTSPGVTTGSATNRPTPPEALPEADRSAAPTAGQIGSPPATKNNDQR